MPKGKTIIHSTLDPAHLNKDVEARIGLVGDAGLVLDRLAEGDQKRASALTAMPLPLLPKLPRRIPIGSPKWMPKLTSNDAPLNPTACCGICSTRST